VTCWFWPLSALTTSSVVSEARELVGVDHMRIEYCPAAKMLNLPHPQPGKFRLQIDGRLLARNQAGHSRSSGMSARECRIAVDFC